MISSHPIPKQNAVSPLLDSKEPLKRMKSQAEVIDEYKKMWNKDKLSEKDINQVSKFAGNTKSLREIVMEEE